MPFSWLNADGKLALERWEICVVPSLRLAGRRQESISTLRAFAVGHPGLPEQNQITNVQDELELFRSIFEVSNYHTPSDTAATPAYVLHEILPQADIIHFACHGECDAITPLMSCLQLEPDEQHSDGRLLFWEISGTSLHAKLVSLFACQTAMIEGPISFPESLALGFLGGGAQYVLASLWDAYSPECSQFATNLYTAIKKKEDPVTAFNKAQKKQVERWNLPKTGDIYATITDDDFAKFGNFMLLSAR